MSHRPISVPATWPEHYSPDCIAAIRAINKWRTTYRLSGVAIGRMVGGGNSTINQILCGRYGCDPSHFLERVLRAAKLPLPEAWMTEADRAAAEPAPVALPAAVAPSKPSRPRYGCWEPGETSDADAPLRAAVLRALAHTHSGSPLAVPALLEQLVEAGAAKADARAALAALVADRRVVQARVVIKRKATDVVYLMGRVAQLAPARRRGAIVIEPSRHAKSVHGGPAA